MALLPLVDNPYEQLRWFNKPERVRWLLLGESPPDPGKGPIRFFYHPQFRAPDNLYRGVIESLYGDQPDLRDKSKHLARLKADGWWLLDSVEFPINLLRDETLRCQAIRSGFRHLRTTLARPDVRPEVGMVICMPRVFHELSTKIEALGIPVLHREPIPFPLGTGIPAFREALRSIVNR